MTKNFHSHSTIAGLVLAMVWPAGSGWADYDGDGSMKDSASLEASNRTAVEAAFASWRDGTGSPFDLLADDATWTIAGRSMAAGTYESRDAFLTDVIRPFNARMRTGLKPEIHDLYADGDTVIVHFDARSTARDGRPYENSYAWFLEMQGGRIVNATAFFDSIEFDDLWRRVAPVSTE